MRQQVALSGHVTIKVSTNEARPPFTRTMLRRLWQWRHSAADSPTEAPLAEAYKGLVKFKPSKAEPDSVHTFE